MPRGPELTLVNNMIKAIRASVPGVMVVKIVGGPWQDSGLPDLLVLAPPDGRAIWLEAKAPRPGERPETTRGRTSAIQDAKIDKLRRVGCRVEVVISVEEAVQVVREEQFSEGT